MLSKALSRAGPGAAGLGGWSGAVRGPLARATVAFGGVWPRHLLTTWSNPVGSGVAGAGGALAGREERGSLAADHGASSAAPLPRPASAYQREFNLEGPSDPEKHYFVDPLQVYEDRKDVVFNLEVARELVRKEKYFIVHGPRQSMKTSYLWALQKHLDEEATAETWPGGRRPSCLLVSAQDIMRKSKNTPKPVQEAQLLLAKEIVTGLRELPFSIPLSEIPPASALDNPLREVLYLWSQWERARGRSAVLLIDEYDTLEGDTLLSTTDTLRTAYHGRMVGRAPSTIVLCGMRDLRHARVMAEGKMQAVVGSGSPFNIAHERWGRRTQGFRPEDVANLYGQWTAERGLPVSHGAVTEVMKWSGGHPWIVNLLGDELDRWVCGSSISAAPGPASIAGVARPESSIEAEHVEAVGRKVASEWRTNAGMTTHFGSLVSRMAESRDVEEAVKKALGWPEARPADAQLALDLGLVVREEEDGPLKPANRLYEEVLPYAVANVVLRERYGLERAMTDLRQCFDATTREMDWDKAFGFVARSLSQQFPVARYSERDLQSLMRVLFLGLLNGSGAFMDEEKRFGSFRVDLFLNVSQMPGPQPSERQNRPVELKVQDVWSTNWDDHVEQARQYAEVSGAAEAVLVVVARQWTRAGPELPPGARAVGAAAAPAAAEKEEAGTEEAGAEEAAAAHRLWTGVDAKDGRPPVRWLLFFHTRPAVAWQVLEEASPDPMRAPTAAEVREWLGKRKVSDLRSICRGLGLPQRLADPKAVDPVLRAIMTRPTLDAYTTALAERAEALARAL